MDKEIPEDYAGHLPCVVCRKMCRLPEEWGKDGYSFCSVECFDKEHNIKE